MPVQALESVGQNLAAQTTTYTSPDFVNRGSRGVVVTLVTAVIGTGNITLSVQGKDRISGTYYTLLTGAAVSTNTTNRYTVSPSIPVVANVSVRDVLPEIWRLQVVANNANPASYSVGAVMVP
jgi:hypothetical protein